LVKYREYSSKLVKESEKKMQEINKNPNCNNCVYAQKDIEKGLVCSMNIDIENSDDNCSYFTIESKHEGLLIVKKPEKSMFKNIFSFDGRTRRKEYFLSRLIFNVLLFFIIYIDSYYNGYTRAFELLYFPLILFRVTSEIKRMHDRNSSWFFLFVPFYSLILFFGDSDQGTNKYGKSPK
jgi:uncharacterized membrane protein YhaH (DUF805 family)